jgi:hypothetical protein
VRNVPNIKALIPKLSRSTAVMFVALIEGGDVDGLKVAELLNHTDPFWCDVAKYTELQLQ